MLKVVRSKVMDLPTKLSLSYFWCGGFMLSMFMVLQVISGVFLSLFYSVGVGGMSSFALLSEWTDSGVVSWLMRYLHVWGVSTMFLLMLLHMGRNLYYSSYSKVGVWNVGFMLYLLLMVEAFLGYILPWHQMSYWAATVLTSMILSVPFVGGVLYSYIVGGFSVTVGETLVRVFPLHVSLGFVLLGLVVVHLFYLHKKGSNSPLKVVGSYSDCLYFHSYYSVKDGVALLSIMSIVVGGVLLCPNVVLDSEAFVEANALVTPVSMKPEWYFLAFYAMLRSVSSKMGGLILVLMFLVVLWLPSQKESAGYSVGRQVVFWGIGAVFLLLSWLGACHAERPFVEVSLFFSLIMLFLLGWFKMSYEMPFSGKRLFMI